jgi:hypothetical protein
MKPVRQRDASLFAPEFQEQARLLWPNRLAGPPAIGVPFYYVNGNDEAVFGIDDQFFAWRDLRFSGRTSFQCLGEDKRGRIAFVNGATDGPLALPVACLRGKTKRPTGMYMPLAPSFGRFAIEAQGERVTVHGCSCTFGLKSRTLGLPDRKTDIVLSHLPPHGVLDLSKRFGIDHIGCAGLRKAVIEQMPRVLVCGHSHFWGGHKQRLGSTMVVNVSASDDRVTNTSYAIIETGDWTVRVQHPHWPGIRPVRGVSSLYEQMKRCMRTRSASTCSEAARTVRMWANCGFISDSKLPELFQAAQREGIDTTMIAARVRSLRWRKPRVIDRINLDPEKHVFVDVETGLAEGDKPGQLWLIGVFHAGQLRQFRHPSDWDRFLSHLDQCQVRSLASWTRYDSKVLHPLLSAARPQIKYVDACARASNCVVWHTYALDNLYEALFPKTEAGDHAIPGRLAGLYADHLILPGRSCKHCPGSRELVNLIRKKNERDLLRMYAICQKLWEYRGTFNPVRHSDCNGI